MENFCNNVLSFISKLLPTYNINLLFSKCIFLKLFLSTIIYKHTFTYNSVSVKWINSLVHKRKEYVQFNYSKVLFFNE